MRGKKIDTNFVADFVASCVKEGYVSSETICIRANEKIVEIDRQIKEVEELKKLRSKFCDVIISFDTIEKVKDKSEDREILSFHNIENKNISLEIITLLESRNNRLLLSLEQLSKLSDPDQSIFVIKQMIKMSVLRHDSDTNIVPGTNYQDYKDFLNKTYNIRPMNEHGFIKYGTDN